MPKKNGPGCTCCIAALTLYFRGCCGYLGGTFTYLVDVSGSIVDSTGATVATFSDCANPCTFYLSPGTYTIYANHTGYLAYSTTLTLPNGSTTETLTLTADPTGYDYSPCACGCEPDGTPSPNIGLYKTLTTGGGTVNLYTTVNSAGGLTPYVGTLGVPLDEGQTIPSNCGAPGTQSFIPVTFTHACFASYITVSWPCCTQGDMVCGTGGYVTCDLAGNALGGSGAISELALATVVGSVYSHDPFLGTFDANASWPQGGRCCFRVGGNYNGWDSLRGATLTTLFSGPWYLSN